MKKKNSVAICLFAGLFAAMSTAAFAGMSTNSVPAVPNFSNLTVSGLQAHSLSSSRDGKLRIDWTASCFATNIRNVANPLAPTSDIEMTVKVKGIASPIVITCPSKTTIPAYARTELSGCKVTPIPGVTSEIKNTGATTSVILQIPKWTKTTENLSTDGRYTYSEEKASSQIESLSFRQLLPADGGCSDYTLTQETDETGTITYYLNRGTEKIAWYYDSPDYGTTYLLPNDNSVRRKAGNTYQICPNYGPYPPKNALLTASHPEKPSVSPDGGLITIHSSFPGTSGAERLQAGYCGNYYSPLMLFFNKERPKFDGKSSFPIIPGSEIFWPESEASGFFLARDDRGNGKIERANQLFGQGDGFDNGFESLRRFDSNKDGVIDARDKIFKELVLWRDTNGNGKTDPGEIVSLEKAKITSISLKYSIPGTLNYGVGARVNEVSSFTYIGKDGKTHKGDVEDIWLAATPRE